MKVAEEDGDEQDGVKEKEERKNVVERGREPTEWLLLVLVLDGLRERRGPASSRPLSCPVVQVRFDSRSSTSAKAQACIWGGCEASYEPGRRLSLGDARLAG